MATKKNPATITIYGRLSFPVFTWQEAVERNRTAPRNIQVANDADVKPSFNLLLEESQLDKLMTHIKDVYLPWVSDQHRSGADRYKQLDDKQMARLVKQLDSDWTEQPPHILLKPVSDKSLELMPDAVASVKLSGNKGEDMTLKAIVNSADELAVDDGSIIAFPCIRPIGESVHKMYPGAYVAATVNLYAYFNSAPGLSGGCATPVFKADAERFGGGVEIDEDEIFLD